VERHDHLRFRHVVVMGVAGSGKSTVGTLLAHRLGLSFADADDFHSEQAKAAMAAGHPLTDADRAPWLSRLAEWLGSQPEGVVLACSALKRSYRDVLRTGANPLFFLELAVEEDVVFQRVRHRSAHFMPTSLLGSQFETLEPLQPDEMGAVVDASRPLEELIDVAAGIVRSQ